MRWSTLYILKNWALWNSSRDFKKEREEYIRVTLEMVADELYNVKELGVVE